jgi:hypothetical protein
MTYRNLLPGVRYQGYDTAPPSGAQGPDLGPIALITDYAAQLLVRTRAYARTHTQDTWPAWVSALVPPSVTASGPC